MNKNFISALVILLIFPSFVLMQTDTTFDFQNDIDLIFDNENEEENELIFDRLENLIENPINLNSCTIEDLLELPYISRTDAEAIIDYRKTSGTIFSKNELLNIPGLPRNITISILPYVYVKNVYDSKSLPSKTFSKSKSVSLNFRNRMIEDLNTRVGFSDNKFIGSKYKFYNRAKVSILNYEAEMLTEKDAGEKSFYDFYSFYFLVNNLWKFKQIILGDYFIEFGEGLALWNSYSISKATSSLINFGKNRSNLSPYKSSDENKYFHGGAFSFMQDNFTFVIFYSNNKNDGKIDADDTTLSLTFDGYHRTESEIKIKDKLSLLAFGGITDINFSDNLSLKLLNINYRFESNNDTLDLKQKIKSVFSIANKLSNSSISFTGEAALISNKIKVIQNLSIRFNKNFSSVFSYRSYPKGTGYYFGNGFGESSSRENEQGFYTGLRFVNQFGILNFYFDLFRFGSTDNYPFSLSGNEFLIFYQKYFTNVMKFSAKYFFEKKEIPVILENIYQASTQQIKRLRFEFEINPFKNISNTTRIEFSRFNVKDITLNDDGFLIFNDIKLRLFSNKLFTFLRINFFRTDSYQSRIYSFENDFTGVMTNPAFFDEGYKWYIFIKYFITKNFSLSFKYSELIKPDADFIGTGLNQIFGNSDRKLALQIDFAY